MSTTFVKEGKIITYINAGSAIVSGAVVIVGTQIGIALVDIAATTGVGAVAMEGVFTVPKVTAAVIAQGEEVMYDSSTSKFDDISLTLASGDVSNCCVAWEAGTSSMTELKVKLNVGVGLVT